jgi:hypothetical protein
LEGSSDGQRAVVPIMPCRACSGDAQAYRY